MEERAKAARKVEVVPKRYATRDDVEDVMTQWGYHHGLTDAQWLRFGNERCDSKIAFWLKKMGFEDTPVKEEYGSLPCNGCFRHTMTEEGYCRQCRKD